MLDNKGVNLQVLDQSINTADATGRLLFNMLGAIGQFETEIRAERQMEGIHKAKQRGVVFGRQKKLSEQDIQKLKEKRGQGVLIKELMKEYGLSKASIYRYLEPLVKPIKARVFSCLCRKKRNNLLRNDKIEAAKHSKYIDK